MGIGDFRHLDENLILNSNPHCQDNSSRFIMVKRLEVTSRHFSLASLFSYRWISRISLVLPGFDC